MTVDAEAKATAEATALLKYAESLHDAGLRTDDAVVAIKRYMRETGLWSDAKIEIKGPELWGVTKKAMREKKQNDHRDRYYDSLKRSIIDRPGVLRNPLMFGSCLPRHDEGNARRFAHYLQDRVRYVKDADAWLSWDGKRWRPCVQGDLLALGREVADKIDEEIPHSAGDERSTHRDWAKRSHSSSAINAMIALAKGSSDLWIESQELDQAPWLLTCQNGTVDLRTGELREHDPADLITQAVPLDYDPDATCPTWTALVARTFQDAAQDGSTLDLVRRALGYSLVGNNIEKRMFIIEGPSDCGKSQLVQVVQAVVGPDYAHKSKTELIARVRGGHHSSERLSLSGKRFASVSETSSTFNLDESTLKELTGDREVTTYKLYSGVERRTPVTWTIWLCTNEFPNVLDWDDAIRRRVMVLPAGPSVPEHEQDLTLCDRILECESQGVLTWLVQGCVAWHQEWTQAQADPMRANTGLPLSDSVLMRTQQYAMSQDDDGRFIQECLAPGGRVARSSVMNAYKDWRGRGETTNRNRLYARILSSFPDVKVERERDFVGVHLVVPHVPENIESLKGSWG